MMMTSRGMSQTYETTGPLEIRYQTIDHRVCLFICVLGNKKNYHGCSSIPSFLDAIHFA